MRCVDNSELTLDRIDDTLNKIEFYRNHVKTGDWSDVFYNSHLAVIETGLRELSSKFDNPPATQEEWLRVWDCARYTAKGVDYKVLQFISDILYHQGEYNAEIIRSLFRAGYCYYFALILKDAFKRGNICLAYPYSHIVWVDDNNVAYDIEGVYTGYEALLDVKLLGKELRDFTHIPDSYSGMSKADVNALLEKLRARVPISGTLLSENLTNDSIWKAYCEKYNIKPLMEASEWKRFKEHYGTVDFYEQLRIDFLEG